MPRIPVPDVLLRVLGRQLGGPSGPLGALVARMLNKGNATTVAAAVDALALTGGETVADIGFGGGLGLDLLLDASGDTGRVHGVEPSADMLDRARRSHRDAVASGRLELHEATMAALPFADGALAGWISVNTVYFVDDLDVAFREIARVLAPAGTGVIGIADPAWMGRQPFTRHGFTLRPVADVVAALAAAGLDVEHRTLGDREPVFHLLVGTRPSVRR